MLTRASALLGSRIDASDGEIGTIKDLYFDDEWWGIRYLLLDCSQRTAGRDVVLSTHFLEASLPGSRFLVPFTSREMESLIRLNQVQQMGLSRVSFLDPLIPGGLPEGFRDQSHLRRASQARESLLIGRQGAIGHLTDMMIQPEIWAIGYFIVEMSTGRQSLVAPKWVTYVDWSTNQIHVDLAEDELDSCPPCETAEEHAPA